MSIPQLRKSSNGYFYAHWSDARRSKRTSLGTTDPAVAEERFANWLLLRQRPAGEEENTVYTVADCWTVYRTKHLATTASLATGDSTWKALEPHFGVLTVAEIDQTVVDAYVTRRTSSKSAKTGRSLKAATARRELVLLFAALRFCAAKPQKMFSPKLIDAVKLPESSEPRDRWLTAEEMQRMLAAAARLRRGPTLSRGERFLWLALETAGRMTAILELTWDRVDFETRVIHLEVPGRKKTKKRRASVPISTALLPVLKRAYDERDTSIVDAANLVVGHKAAMWGTIQNIAIEAGLAGKRTVPRGIRPKATGISPHVLRHTAATHMARRGVPLWKIAKVLGNTMAMVEKVYSHHCPDDLREAVDLISNGELAPAE